MSQFHYFHVVSNTRRNASVGAMLAGLIALWLVAWNGLAQAQQSTVEPATVEAAARVLDLRTFPVMEGAKVSEMRTLGMLMYEVKSGAKAAFEFQRQQLQKTGWKELPGAYSDATNASSRFTKEGFRIAVSTYESTGDHQKSGWSHVSVVNSGNVATGKLPVPPGVKPFHPDVMEGSYLTDAKVPETAEACRKLLLAAGWEPYGKQSDDPESPMMLFKWNAIKLLSWVSTTPAEGNKTLIRYSTELLQADLPAPPEVADPDYTDYQKTLRFDLPTDRTESIIAFYQKRLPKQGWKATTEQPVTNKRNQFLVFRNPQKEILSLDLTQFTEIVRVELRHQTAAELAAEEQRYKEAEEKKRQELAKKNMKTKLAVPLPATAENVEKLRENTFEFTLGTGGGPAAFRGFREHFLKAGWTEEEGTQIEKNFGNLEFKKDAASLRFSYIDSGITDAEVTVSGSSGLVLEATAVTAEREETPKTAQPNKKKPSLTDIPGVPKLPKGVDLPDVPDIGGLLKGLENTDEKKSSKKKAATGPVKVAEIPVPDDADEVEYSKLTKMIKISSPSDVETLASFYSKELTEKGWTKSNPGVVSKSTAIMKLSKGDASLTISISKSKNGSELTLICNGIVWDEIPPSGSKLK